MCITPTNEFEGPAQQNNVCYFILYGFYSKLLNRVILYSILLHFILFYHWWCNAHRSVKRHVPMIRDEADELTHERVALGSQCSFVRQRRRREFFEVPMNCLHDFRLELLYGILDGWLHMRVPAAADVTDVHTPRPLAPRRDRRQNCR